MQTKLLKHMKSCQIQQITGEYAPLFITYCDNDNNFQSQKMGEKKLWAIYFLWWNLFCSMFELWFYLHCFFSHKVVYSKNLSIQEKVTIYAVGSLYAEMEVSVWRVWMSFFLFSVFPLENGDILNKLPNHMICEVWFKVHSWDSSRRFIKKIRSNNSGPRFCFS